MQFLVELNDSLSATRGQILLMQSLPETRRVYSLVFQQEKQVEVSLSMMDQDSQLRNSMN